MIKALAFASFFVLSASFAQSGHATAGNTKILQEDDLLCFSKGVRDGGYLIVGNLQADGTLLTSIQAVQGFGGNIELFKGKMILVQTSQVPGKETFELRDTEKDPKTVVKLVKNDDDKLVMIKGKEDR